MEPVSYTHLDVYKRQGAGEPLSGAAGLLCACPGAADGQEGEGENHLLLCADGGSGAWHCRRIVSEMTGKFRETIAKTVKIRYS